MTTTPDTGAPLDFAGIKADYDRLFARAVWDEMSGDSGLDLWLFFNESIPDLIDEIERLRAALRPLAELLPVQVGIPGMRYCAGCYTMVEWSGNERGQQHAPTCPVLTARALLGSEATP